MKITIASREEDGFIEKRLVEECKNSGHEVAFFDFSTVEEALNYDDWGDIVIWRRISLLDKAKGSFLSEKIPLMKELQERGIHIINISQANHPHITRKDYQQRLFEKITRNDETIHRIPTYTVADIEELKALVDGGKLIFPFIEKRATGSRGRHVRLINSLDEIEDIRDQVYQPFIENDGDFRVIVIGGKVFGVMLRKGSEDDFRNNISQGGTGSLVTNKEVLKHVEKLALKTASIFDLSMCGVDVIHDKNDNKYKFLEINTIFDWEGFERDIKVNVTAEVIRFCEQIYSRKTADVYPLVKDYFDQNLDYLPLADRYHYLSRLSLFTNNDSSADKLQSLKGEYIGNSEKEIDNTLTALVEELEKRGPLHRSPNRDRLLKERYQKLQIYNVLLFKYLFSKTIHNVDIMENVLKLVSIEELQKQREQILNDREALLTLSTFALNFLYNFTFFENHMNQASNTIDANMLLEVSDGYQGEEIERDFQVEVYYYTHCIINASEFYSKHIDSYEEIYAEMLSRVETVISNNFAQIDLDNKLEYLVCCRIMGHKSPLEAVIRSEAEASLSAVGNFLVDTYNTKNIRMDNRNLPMAEHRNVLYLMAFSEHSRYD